MKTPAPELARTQRWMQVVITHPDGIEAGASSPRARREMDIGADELEQVIRRSRALTSAERLRVYGNAYYARLLECLRSEFPALVHTLGEDTFNRFAFEYLQQYPSHSYTLGRLGAMFPQYLKETRPDSASDEPRPDFADFLIDLARLERAYADVFDEPGPERIPGLRIEILQAIPRDCWADVRLTPFPCVRLVSFQFPVHVYASDVRHERPNPTVPPPETTYLALTRRHYVVHHLPLTSAQFQILKLLLHGRTLGSAIAAVVDVDNAPVAGELHEAFRCWTLAPLFQAAC